MDKQDKFYIIFLIIFLGTLAGIPAYENNQFTTVLKQFDLVLNNFKTQAKEFTDFTKLFIATTQTIIHNQGVLIHNTEVISNNQYQFAHYGFPINNSITTTPGVRNDTRHDFQNITIPSSFYDFD